MKTKEQNQQELLEGARTSTAEQVQGNDFLGGVEMELAEIEKIPAAQVTPRPTRENK